MVRHGTVRTDGSRYTPILRRGKHPDCATRDHAPVAGESDDAF